MSNYISHVFSAEDQQKATDLFNQLLALFGFCINLSTDQRSELPKLSDGRLPFTEKAIDIGNQESQIVAPYISLDEFKKDIDLFKVMGPFEILAGKLFELISDTRMAAGTDAYAAARSIYTSAQNAEKNGVPGMKLIVDELGVLFKGQGNTRGNSSSK